ncbi:MAG: hypothetical protein ACI9GW_003400 [Halieaceae bacterium]
MALIRKTVPGSGKALQLTVRFIFVGLLCGSLSACLITQLKGHVGGASITVSRLNDPTTPVFVGTTQSPESIADGALAQTYKQQTATQRLLWLGSIEVAQNLLERQTLYLVTAQGGKDYDTNQDSRVDEEPLTVQGRWHAIIPGSSFVLRTTKISLLTEAAFQWLLVTSATPLAERDPEEIMLALDTASKRVVADINLDGRVDYSDLLMWDPTLSPDSFRGNLEYLNLMHTSIVLGLDEELMRWAGFQLITGKPYRPSSDNSLFDFLLSS